MLPIQFRISREYKDVSGVVVSVFEKCEKGFVFQHPADEDVNRVHIHGYLFNPTICRKTLSEQIAKKLNLKGNSDFATGDRAGKSKNILDISGAYCYGSKWSTIAPQFIKNISPDLVDELKNYSRKMGSQYNIARNSVTNEITIIKEIKTKSKPTQYQHVITIVNRINELHPDLQSKSLTERQRTVFDMVYSYFQQNELFMGKYKQLDFLDNVLLRLGDTDYKNTLFADFSHRTSRQLV